MVKSHTIILPNDSSVEDLRKTLKESIKDPRIRQFEELRDQGFDSETASELSGLHTLQPEAMTEAVLISANRGPGSPAYEIVRASSYEIPTALRNVGSAAGSALGSVIGMNLLRGAAANATTVGLVAGTGILVAGSMVVAKYVTRAQGAWWAAAAVLNLCSAVAIVGRAWVKTRKDL